MSNSTVGIKIANGEFFPILDEHFRGSRKKLVLTTVNDNQESVQIDLYKGEGKRVADASYVGSLVVENIQPAAKGEKDIELIIGVDREGNLNASAGDMVTGERQSLSVSLASLGEEETYDIPDFELDESLQDEPADEFSDDLTEDFPDESAIEDSHVPDYEKELEEPGAEKPESEKRKAHPLLLIGFVILGLAIIVLIAFLIFQTFQGPKVPPLQAGGSPAAETIVQAEEAAAAEEEPVEIVQEAEAVTAAEPAAAEEDASGPGPPPQEIWYKIRWGDTLWDISDSFYRSPWYYGKIAQDNKINNPDLIFAETKIRIPAE